MTTPSYQLNTIEGCQAFIANEPPATIARRILQDQQLCRDGGFPSLVVYCLPDRTDPIARLISDEEIPRAIARMRFSSVVSLIKSYLSKLSRPTPSNDAIPAHLIPSDADLNVALKVLRYIQLPQVGICPIPSTPLEHVIENIQAQLSLGADVRNAMGHVRIQRHCYMCRFRFDSPHRLYPSLCNPCGEFNISSSMLSLSPNLDLKEKIALVTGGRINLGYHTALRLLRCGANVVVSTRYPMDAEKRYMKETDSEQWKARLKIVGADFRSAKDVFALINAVLSLLRSWANGGKAKLDILINNAAQTLTDSVEKEDEHIERESQLKSTSSSDLLLEAGYSPRVRGGAVSYQIESSTSEISPTSFSLKPSMEAGSLITSKDTRSSWVQRISEIPYEDVISAHSVNTFVPFILLRELLPHMSARPKSKSSPTDRPLPNQNPNPAGYVVNVSSREGIFENKPGSAAKNGHHVHTNMSKAALNMLTETEAGSAWTKGRVAVNTVDPGYMSADPMFMEMVGREGEACPIGWEDGAARVLWPIAKGEQGQVIRGRFLKHFAEVDVTR
jgi:NAD(P)-dependent dehydrogenase (short-subunit alcohol dehydrogenase family)